MTMKCRTPLGEFSSVTAAGIAHGVSKDCVCRRLKNPNYPDWQRPDGKKGTRKNTKGGRPRKNRVEVIDLRTYKGKRE